MYIQAKSIIKNEQNVVTIILVYFTRYRFRLKVYND